MIMTVGAKRFFFLKEHHIRVKINEAEKISPTRTFDVSRNINLAFWESVGLVLDLPFLTV